MGIIARGGWLMAQMLGIARPRATRSVAAISPRIHDLRDLRLIAKAIAPMLTIPALVGSGTTVALSVPTKLLKSEIVCGLAPTCTSFRPNAKTSDSLMIPSPLKSAAALNDVLFEFHN